MDGWVHLAVLVRRNLTGRKYTSPLHFSLSDDSFISDGIMIDREKNRLSVTSESLAPFLENEESPGELIVTRR